MSVLHASAASTSSTGDVTGHVLQVLCLEMVSVFAFQVSSVTDSVLPVANQASLLSMVSASLATPTVLSAQEMCSVVLSASVDSKSMLALKHACQVLSVTMVRQLTTMVYVKGYVTQVFCSIGISVSLEVASMDTVTMVLVDAFETLKVKLDLLLALTVNTC